MEKEKRQRVSLPQMVVSGEGGEARVKVKVAAGGGEGEAGADGAVGRMVDSSQADDRKLIRLVRERRLLYARNNMPVASYYTQVKNLWDDVAAAMGWSGNCPCDMFYSQRTFDVEPAVACALIKQISK